ncbi:MAG: glycerol-3-phosphate dehydrogenase [NAD(P)+] [Rhodomicrobium sp.]|nr:MAG: glycerol-3-phosphate dehydrogenase [NAD(P)+] [Rhodomicrobium sp.]
MTEIKNIGVIGAGAWGTALAQSACLAGCHTELWSHEEETASAINTSAENKLYLPGIPLDPALKATTNLEKAASNKDALLMVAPAQFVRSVAQQLVAVTKDNMPVLICAKGIEIASGKLMSDILAETMPTAIPAILSGPSFAADVARGLPTAVTLAVQDEELGHSLAASLSHQALRPYWSDDLIGVQIGGAVKNILAIAAGIVVGKELGASAHASLISRGFAEITRFAETFGAKPQTLMGLSGLGDLVLTCSSPQSRNMSLGIELGKGRTLSEILEQRHSISEGVHTAKAVAKIAREKNIRMPISEAVNAIIEGELTTDEAIKTLLSRPLRSEI